MQDNSGACVIMLLISAGALVAARAYSHDLSQKQLQERLERLEAQMNAMKEIYEERIRALERELAAQKAAAEPGVRESTEPQQHAPPPAPVAPAGEKSVRPVAGVQLSAPDIGVTIDTVGRWSDENQIAEADVGHEVFQLDDANRWRLRAAEFGFSGYVDPYARLDVIVAAHEDDVLLEEAYATLLELPFGTRVRLGKFLLPYGLANTVHEHDLETVDRPLALQEFFGESLLDEGVELSWLLPDPWDLFSELTIAYTNGDEIGHSHTHGEEDAHEPFERDWFEDELVVARWATYFDIGSRAGLQLGLNAARGVNRSNEDTRVMFGGFDAKYRYTWPSERKLTFQLEQLWWDEEARFWIADEEHKDHGEHEYEVLENLDVDIRTHGGYLLADYEFVPRRWSAGSRVDWFGHRHQFDPRRVSPDEMSYGGAAFVTFRPSEFQRWRLQYRHIEFNYGDAEPDADEIMLQATFSLGFHKPHRF